MTSTPYPPGSTVLRHTREAGIGTTSIKSPPNQIFFRSKTCQEESILRKSTNSTNLAPVCLRAQSQPQRARLHFHTQKKSRNRGAGNSSSLTEITLISCSHNSPMKHQFNPHTNKYPPCNLRLVFSTGQERSLCLVTLFSTQQDNPLLALSNHHTKKKHYLFHF